VVKEWVASVGNCWDVIVIFDNERNIAFYFIFVMVTIKIFFPNP
jgi:hypothetical protein